MLIAKGLNVCAVKFVLLPRYWGSSFIWEEGITFVEFGIGDIGKDEEDEWFGIESNSSVTISGKDSIATSSISRCGCCTKVEFGDVCRITIEVYSGSGWAKNKQFVLDQD